MQSSTAQAGSNLTSPIDPTLTATGSMPVEANQVAVVPILGIVMYSPVGLNVSRKLILLIDHDPSVRSVLQVCLSHFGPWEVQAVATPQQGRELLKTIRPAAIILDTPALEQDGRNIVATLHQGDAVTIPVVLITGKATWFSGRQLEDMGVVGAIAKPFNPLTLPGQIRRFLRWDEEG